MVNVGTWNMQGANHSTEAKWTAIVRPMFKECPLDVMCLQECGAAPNGAVLLTNNFSGIPGLELYRWGTDRAHLSILFFQSDPNGNRCNLAVVSRAQPATGALAYPAAGPIWRPAVGALVNGVAYFSLHAISPGGPDVHGLLQAVAVAAGGAVWVAAGDFNREPGTVPAGPWGVCPPNLPTYSVINPVSHLDYLVLPAGIATVVGTRWDTAQSDHYPVSFTLP